METYSIYSFFSLMLSLCIIILRFIHEVVCINSSSLLVSEYYSIVWISIKNPYNTQFVYPFTYWWTLQLSLFLANKAAMNTHVQVFVWTYTFLSLGQISRRRMIRSYGRCVFNFLWNCHNCFPKSWCHFHPF